MAQTGTNLVAVAEFNVSVVLDAIRRHPTGVARGELAALTGLSGMTVSNVSRRLVEDGLVTETVMPASGRGKPPKILRLIPSGGFAVGVHIDPAVVTYVIVDLAGEVRDHIRTETPVVQDPGRVVGAMARTIEELIVSSGVERSKVLGVGIASPGPINAETGVVLNPPMLPDWHRVTLRDSLSAALRLPVVLEKDSTAAAIAERWFAGHDGARDFIFVYYGTGFATGIAIGGEVLRGVSSNAGDAGHITVDPNGPVCWCGRRGCVGNMAVPRALVERALERQVLSPGDVGRLDDVLDVGAAFGKLADAADAGNPAAIGIHAEAGRALARAVVVTANLLDVQQVVFGGPFWGRLAPVVLSVLPTAVSGDPALVLPHSIRFVESAVPVDVASVGAATLVLDQAFSPRPTTMLLASGK
ncbi:ROK family protein [Cryptosporangium sp. NPDC048952]|uniref:ROK family transcriptional regulator n=1 Tax=Cryptosporangium sp. NPDC048952 TaxID=3363961 RepID=UPI00371155BD